MNCETAHRFVHDRLDDELSPDDLDRLNEHLSGCENCRTFSHSIRRLQSGLDALRERSVLNPSRVRSRRRIDRFQRIYSTIRVAAMVAIIVTGGLVIRSAVRPRESSPVNAQPAVEASVARFEPQVRLGAKSNETYMPVIKSTANPRVHVVWLFRSAAPPSDAGDPRSPQGRHDPSETGNSRTRSS